MTRHWLATAAALTLLTGAAFAQGTVSTQSTTTTVVPPVVVPPIACSTTTKTERVIDAYGNQVESSQTYKSGNTGTASRVETQVKRPDGSTESSYREQWSAPGVVTGTVVPSIAPTLIVPNGSVTTINPDGSTTTTRQTTTTTIGR